jgi:Flp pilus assembly pilin Flp
MRKEFLRLWRDDRGALVATEWVFVATILILALITGLVAVRQAILSELVEFANAVTSLDQSYRFRGQSLVSDGDKDQDKHDNDSDEFRRVHAAGSNARDVEDRQFLFSTRKDLDDIEQPPCD